MSLHNSNQPIADLCPTKTSPLPVFLLTKLYNEKDMEYRRKDISGLMVAIWFSQLFTSGPSVNRNRLSATKA